MSKPTTLNPQYVVQEFKSGADDLYYFQSDYSPHVNSIDPARDGFETKTPPREMMYPDPKYALIFVNLGAAARVAASEGAHVRVITSSEELKEFGR